MEDRKRLWMQRRRRVSEIIEAGTSDDWVSRGYDLFSTFMTLVNVVVTVLYTFDEMELNHGPELLLLEAVTVAFFAIEYILRVWTAQFLYPEQNQWEAVKRYTTSFAGLIDLLSFLPYYLPIFFPTGAAVFRMFRVVRLFRLFQINAYYDSLNVIAEVIASKKQQLLSSVFTIFLLMLASSLCMYSLEHEAQPEVFTNAFSGMWWSVSTLLTVGYGDIYPITPAGQIMGIIISFLGVGMVAIPTGIISAAFVEQYSKVKRFTEYAQETDIRFIKFQLTSFDHWTGQEIRNLALPVGVIVALVQRGETILIPRGDLKLLEGDILVLGAESFDTGKHLDLKEITLREQHPWNGLRIRELDISRQTIIVMVERRGRMITPRGDLILKEGDQILMYSQTRLTDADVIPL